MCIRDRADTYDSGGDDIGNDLLVDKSGNVYICGESHGNDKDFFCLLYTSDAADERSSVDLGGSRIITKKNRMTQYARS